MTQTTTGYPPPYASSRLERSPDTPLGGVCTALARATGTDVVLWRVLAVVLTLFGGLGIVLYLAGMVAIPEQGAERSLADRLLHGPDRRLSGGQWLVVALLAIGTAALVDGGNGLLVATVLGGLLLLAYRARTRSGAGLPTGTATGPAGGGPAGQSSSVRTGSSPEGAWSPPVSPGQTAPYAVPAPRPRSPFVGATASLAALTVGILLLLGATGRASMPTEVVLAAALGVVGLGLLAGSWFGRSGWLVALAGLLGLALAGTVAARPVVDSGLGSRSWQPVTAGSYRLGVGDATLDLRSLPVPPTGSVAVTARVDVGHLLVLVPDGTRVALDARAQLGDLLLLGADSNGRRVHRHVTLGPAGEPQVRLDLSVRTGQVEVRRG